MFSQKNIVLVISGGVAAYKAASFARLLVKMDATVKVVMTATATEFITPKTMAVLTNQPVLTANFTENLQSDCKLPSMPFCPIRATIISGRFDSRSSPKSAI